MIYKSIQQTAIRLGVSERSVRRWAMEGKIPGAHKSGRDWLIPAGITGPSSYVEKDASGIRQLMRVPLPFVRGSFEPGHALEYIDSLEDEDDRNIATGEYYYFIGKCSKAVDVLEPYLCSPDPALRFTSALICFFASFALGRQHLSYLTKDQLEKQIEEGLNSESVPELHALGVLVLNIVYVLMHLPHDNLPLLENHIAYLPEGLKVLGTYLMAYKAYLRREYDKALTIADVTAAMFKDPYPIGMSHIHIIAAVVLMNMKRPEAAKDRFMKAWELLKDDGMIEVVSEHLWILQGIPDISLKQLSPKNYNIIMDLSGKHMSAWAKIHSEIMNKEVRVHLSATEVTIALMYDRGWSAKEIAIHLNFSQATVRKYIQIIYEKLSIRDKKELREFMLH